MKFNLLLKIVLKNMFQRKLRFFFTLLAAGIAVGSTIFLFSLGYGLEKISTDQLVQADALKQIEATSDRPTTLKLNTDLASQIKNFSEVETVASSTSLAGKIKIENANMDSPFYAVSNNYYALSQLNLAAGRFPVDEEKDYILISEKMVSTLGKTNENLLNQKIKINLIIPPSLGKQIAADQEYDAKIIGVIAGSGTAFAYVNTVNSAAAGADSYSVIKIKVKDKNDITATRKKVEDLGLKTTYVGDTLDQMNKFFSFFRILLAGFGAIGVIIALLGMFNTLTVSLMERMKEISLLKILGSKEKTIFWLFATESLIFGFFGFILGYIIFYILKIAVDLILFTLARRMGSEMVNIFTTPFFVLIIIFVGTMIIAFLTGLLPARRATRVDPMEVQRYE